jgi:hypothetical protein
VRVEYAEIGLIVGGVVIAILAIARSRAGGLQLLLGMIGLGAGWYFRPPGGLEDVVTMSPGGEVFIKEPAFVGLLSASALLALFGLARTIQGTKANAAAAAAAEEMNRLRLADADVAAWDRITDKTSADALQEYLVRHPDGRFAELARVKLQRLEGKAVNPAPGEAMPARGTTTRETAVEKAPPWATETAADDLLFPSEKGEKAARPAKPARPAEPAKPARLAEPKDDLFASTYSARRRYPEPQGSAAPLVAFLLVMLAAGGGGGAWWWFNGGANLFDGGFGGREVGKPVEQAVAESEPLPMPPVAAPAEQAQAADDTAPAAPAATSPPYDVEPPTSLKLVLVKGSNVRLRTAPFANNGTGVVAVAKPGAALRVIGRVTRPDWVWYQVTMDDGRVAFVRSDVTSAPERGPDAPPERAATPLVASSAPLVNAVRQLEATPSPAVEVPPLQVPAANDQPASVPPANDPADGAASTPVAEVPAGPNDPRPSEPAPPLASGS